MEIKWLKGYCIPSTFMENIPDQSWGSNRGTPCTCLTNDAPMYKAPLLGRPQVGPFCCDPTCEGTLQEAKQEGDVPIPGL